MADFVRVDIKGDKELLKTLDKYPKEAVDELEKAQQANALDMQSVARALVQQGARTGRIYKRGDISHQASAPGEPPKSDTGFLVAHIRGFVELRLVAVLEAATAYARHLEFGTSKMGSRPFMDRSAATVLPRALARMKAAIIRAGKRFQK